MSAMMLTSIISCFLSSFMLFFRLVQFQLCDSYDSYSSVLRSFVVFLCVSGLALASVRLLVSVLTAWHEHERSPRAAPSSLTIA